METLLSNAWFVWLLIGIFFLILELVTTALVSIWFVAAAVLVAIESLFIDSVAIQVMTFLVLSLIFLVVFKKIYNKRIKKEKDDVKAEENMIGKVAVTAEETNADGGRVLAGDVYWRAVTKDGSTIEADSKVVITGVEDTTLIIERK
ncbi:MAG: NfeD family protein [Clostridiales bacterium]|nr:NfeD family protein [Clostridiales bacterium]